MQKTVVLPAGEGFEQPVSTPVSDVPAGVVSGRRTEVLRRNGQPRPTGRIRSPVPTSGADQVGGLREAALWRPRTGSEVSGTLHPSGGHLQSATVIDGRWSRDV